jgi:hypothetical protein
MTIKWIGKDGEELASGFVVQDGQSIKVPLMMADAATVDIAAITRAAMTDASMPSAAMHKPGAGILSDADRDARESARQKRIARQADAWRSPPPLQATVADATQRTTPADVSQVNSAWARRNARVAQAWKMGMGATR